MTDPSGAIQAPAPDTAQNADPGLGFGSQDQFNFYTNLGIYNLGQNDAPAQPCSPIGQGTLGYTSYGPPSVGAQLAILAITSIVAPEEDPEELALFGAEDLGSSAADGGTRIPDAILDITGKVHGQLPSPAELGEYDSGALATLRAELEKSVQTRIAKTVELGSDYGHSARIAEEQALIRSITKYLADHPSGSQ